MASLQQRHTRECAVSTTGRAPGAKPTSRWTTFTSTKTEPVSWKGRDKVVHTVVCTCQPTYYSVAWLDKKPVRKKIGQNRKDAERLLPHVKVAEDNKDRVLLGVADDVAFDEWADKWLSRLQVAASTKDSYSRTMARCKEVFKQKPVRRLDDDDVHELIAHLTVSRTSGKANTSTTKAKHLRVLSACLDAAIPKYASSNPVKMLDKSLRPKKRVQKAAWFEDEELPRLFAELADSGVYRVACLLSLKTGMRVGEVSALRWMDVSATDNTIHVRRQFTGGIDKPGTKSGQGKIRDVPAPDEVFEELSLWWREIGCPDDKTLVLPCDTKTGFINEQVLLRRVLYPAMDRAGIPREEARYGERRKFHSFRHTFARIWLETPGQTLSGLSEHLGHSSIQVTASTYAHISVKASRKQAQALAGAFPV